MVLGHHTNNTMDKINISCRNKSIVPTITDKSLFYFNSAEEDCCIGSTSRAGAAKNIVHDQHEKSMLPPFYLYKPQQQHCQIAFTSMGNGYNFNWNDNYLNAYDLLSISSTESPKSDILPSIQVKVEDKHKVGVNSDHINPSRSMGFDSAVNFQPIRKRRNMGRKRRCNFGTSICPETLTQGFQPRPLLATWSQLGSPALDSFVLADGTSSVGSAGAPDEPGCNGKDDKIKNLKFLFQKELRNSDVGPLGRMVLPKKEAEANLPTLTEREGMQLCIEDVHSSKNWIFKYKYWPNNKSRMYVIENTGEFVKTHCLRLGDFVMFYKDEKNDKYIVRAKKAINQLMITSGNSVDENSPYSSATFLEEGRNQQSTTDKENEATCESPYASGESLFIDNKKMSLATVEDTFSKEFNIEFPPDIVDLDQLESIPSFGSNDISLDDFLN